MQKITKCYSLARENEEKQEERKVKEEREEKEEKEKWITAAKFRWWNPSISRSKRDALKGKKT